MDMLRRYNAAERHLHQANSLTIYSFRVPLGLVASYTPRLFFYDDSLFCAERCMRQ